MRKLLAITVVAFLFTALPAGVEAQGVSGGIKAGVSVAKLDFDDADVKSRTAFAGGGFLTFSLTPGFSLQAEALLAEKGYKADVSGGIFGAGAEAEVAIDYFEVPVLARVNFGPAHLFAGPAVGFEIGCQVSVNDENDEDCGGQQAEGRKSTDVGVALGGGFDYDLGGGGAIVVDARYTLGLTDLDEAANSSAKSRAFSAMAGFKLALGARR